MTKFASGLLDSFKISPVDAHVAAFTFGTKGSTIFNFGQYYDGKQIKDQIEKINYSPSQKSNLAAAFKTAESEIFSVQGKSRLSTPRVLVIITDGLLGGTNEAEAVKLAKELKLPKYGHGMNIIVVGVGPKGDANVLRQVAAPSADAKKKGIRGEVFKFANFDVLRVNKNQLNVAEEMCACKYKYINSKICLLTTFLKRASIFFLSCFL